MSSCRTPTFYKASSLLQQEQRQKSLVRRWAKSASASKPLSGKSAVRSRAFRSWCVKHNSTSASAHMLPGNVRYESRNPPLSSACTIATCCILADAFTVLPACAILQLPTFRSCSSVVLFVAQENVKRIALIGNNCILDAPTLPPMRQVTDSLISQAKAQNKLCSAVSTSRPAPQQL